MTRSLTSSSSILMQCVCKCCGHRKQLWNCIRGVETFLTTQTCESIDKNYNVQVKGVMSPADHTASNLFEAYRGSVPMVIKVPSKPGDAEKEAYICQELGSDAYKHFLAGPQELITYRENTQAIVMPRYPSTWEQIPTPMDPLHVLRIGKQMEQALSYMHQQGYGHNDVKPSNVFVETDGTCRLGDFGSANKLGQPLTYSTSVFLPRDWPEKVTSVEVDRYMLVISMIYKLGHYDAHVRMSRQDVEAFVQEVSNELLNEFMRGLLPCTD